MKRILGATAVAALLLGSGRADAATMTYYDVDLSHDGNPVSSHPNSDAAKDAFFAAASGLGTEHFDGFPAQTLIPDPNFDGLNPRTAGDPLSLNFGGVTGELTDSQGNCDMIISRCGYVTDDTTSKRQAISGSNFYLAENSVSFSVTFDTLLNAFGFFATDVGNIGEQIALSTYRNGVLLETFLIGPTAGPQGAPVLAGNVLFFGFIVDPINYFDQLVFSNTGTALADVFGFDDFSAQAAPVPEPTTMLLLGTGLVAAVRRRRQSRQQ